MRIRNTVFVTFSPCGTTHAVACALAAGLGGPITTIDMTLPAARCTPREFGPDDLVVFAFPVYGGRIPLLGAEVFTALSGKGTPAALVAVYGNRDYEDALLEMQREAEGRGFVPFAAVAAIAEHCMVAEVAHARPDAKDATVLEQFGASIGAYIKGMESPSDEAFTAPGVFPYRKEPLRVNAPPKPTDACTKCGVCASVCPAGAIPENAPDTADGEKCIICMACVKKCPECARKPAHPTFEQAVSWLRANCAERKEPELFPAGIN